jgi:molybdopterin biosynthesis enzyme
MAAASETIQAIDRLTPLAEVLAMVDRGAKPVTPGRLEVAMAAGRTLAADVVAPTRPSAAMALHDGWALSADVTLGAGGYAPAVLAETLQRIETGQLKPPDTDNVVAFGAMKVTRNRAEALVTVNPGDGVLPAGGDCDPAIPRRRAGERLRITDLAAFAAAGLARVTVREPRIRVLPLRGNGIIVAAARLVANDIEGRGGSVRLDDSGHDLDVVLAADNADAIIIIIIGGTGSGRNVTSVQTLAREGQLAVHDIALTPGETSALSFISHRPVLLPGRLDATLAAWLVVRRRQLARLAGSNEHDPGATVTLARKVTSTVGLAEFIPVRQSGDCVEPLAAKNLPLSTLARADGWILVPAESEGYPAGTAVAVRAWHKKRKMRNAK